MESSDGTTPEIEVKFYGRSAEQEGDQVQRGEKVYSLSLESQVSLPVSPMP
jgi:hypothetical protein